MAIRPVLTRTARSGPSARKGRPLAILELYQGNEINTQWTHAVTLTGSATVTMKTPVAEVWKPASIQIEPVAFAEADPPHGREQRRLSQLKELARGFTAHEFWDPENSRFEMRLLAQPVHRYSDVEAGIHDGAVFVLAHGTNPEVIVLIEALGETLEKARWHYSLARLGSAELHVELDGKEVWKRGRTPGVRGQPEPIRIGCFSRRAKRRLPITRQFPARKITAQPLQSRHYVFIMPAGERFQGEKFRNAPRTTRCDRCRAGDPAATVGPRSATVRRAGGAAVQAESSPSQHATVQKLLERLEGKGASSATAATWPHTFAAAVERERADRPASCSKRPTNCAAARFSRC